MLAVKLLALSTVASAITVDERLEEVQLVALEAEMQAQSFERALMIADQLQELVQGYEEAESKIDGIIEENEKQIQEMEEGLKASRESLSMLRAKLKHKQN